MATNASGASSPIATSTNTLHVLSPNNDDDGDGLTNAVEVALGTDPLNPDTSGDGLPDGWQVFYGSTLSTPPSPVWMSITAVSPFFRTSSKGLARATRTVFLPPYPRSLPRRPELRLQ